MDSYGQIGPEAGDYDDDLCQIAAELRDGAPVYLRLAAEGTGFQIVLVPQLGLFVNGGEQPAGTVGLDGGVHEDGRYLMVAVERHGHYWFDMRLAKHPSYVAEKLCYPNPVDSATLAEFLDRLGLALFGDTHESAGTSYTTVVVDHGGGMQELRRERG